MTRWYKLLGLLLLLGAGNIQAEKPEFTISIREHLFYPAELQVPANQKIKLFIVNEDATPEEFESYELNREKVILGAARRSYL